MYINNRCNSTPMRIFTKWLARRPSCEYSWQDNSTSYVVLTPYVCHTPNITLSHLTLPGVSHSCLSLSLYLSLPLSVSPFPLLPPSSERFYRLYNYLYLYAYNIIRYIISHSSLHRCIPTYTVNNFTPIFDDRIIQPWHNNEIYVLRQWCVQSGQ